jgi:hypothetical protein
VLSGCGARRLTPRCSGLIVSRSRSFLFAAELDIVRRATPSLNTASFSRKPQHLIRQLVSFFLDLRPRQLNRWLRLRAHGPIWFVTVYGVLLFGFPVTAVISVFNYVLFRRFLNSMRAAFGPSFGEPISVGLYRLVAQSVGIAIVGGLLYGIILWFLMESLYRRHLRMHASVIAESGGHA